MRRIDYFCNLIKAIYNNSKVEYEESNICPTILLGKSGLSDKCKFQNKGSSARYYTRVCDLLKLTFISDNTIYEKENSKNQYVFTCETAIKNALYYLLELGISKEYLLSSDEINSGALIFNIVVNYILSVIFWGDLPDSKVQNIANDDIHELFTESIRQANCWLMTRHFFKISEQALSSYEIIIDAEFSNLIQLNKECFCIDKSIYAVPMNIGDILEIIPFYPLSFSLPSIISPVAIQKKRESNTSLRKGYYKINQNCTLTTSPAPLDLEDLQSNFDGMIPDAIYYILPDLLINTMFVNDVLYLTNLDDECLKNKYSHILTHEELHQELLKRARKDTIKQKKEYYTQKHEYCLSIIDYIIEMADIFSSLPIHEFLTIETPSIDTLASLFMRFNLPFEKLWQDLSTLKNDYDRCFVLYCAADNLINNYSNILISKNVNGSELKITDALKKTLSIEELSIRADHIGDLLNSTFFVEAITEEEKEIILNPDRYKQPKSPSECYQYRIPYLFTKLKKALQSFHDEII